MASPVAGPTLSIEGQIVSIDEAVSLHRLDYALRFAGLKRG